MWREHWLHLNERLRGCRTTALCALIGFVGLLDMLGAVDLRPLVAFFVSDDKKVGAIMTLLSIVFGVSRWATTTAIFVRKQDDG